MAHRFSAMLGTKNNAHDGLQRPKDISSALIFQQNTRTFTLSPLLFYTNAWEVLPEAQAIPSTMEPISVTVTTVLKTAKVLHIVAGPRSRVLKRGKGMDLWTQKVVIFRKKSRSTCTCDSSFFKSVVFQAVANNPDFKQHVDHWSACDSSQSS